MRCTDCAQLAGEASASAACSAAGTASSRATLLLCCFVGANHAMPSRTSAAICCMALAAAQPRRFSRCSGWAAGACRVCVSMCAVRVLGVGVCLPACIICWMRRRSSSRLRLPAAGWRRQHFGACWCAVLEVQAPKGWVALAVLCAVWCVWWRPRLPVFPAAQQRHQADCLSPAEHSC